MTPKERQRDRARRVRNMFFRLARPLPGNFPSSWFAVARIGDDEDGRTIFHASGDFAEEANLQKVVAAVYDRRRTGDPFTTMRRAPEGVVVNYENTERGFAPFSSGTVRKIALDRASRKRERIQNKRLAEAKAEGFKDGLAEGKKRQKTPPKRGRPKKKKKSSELMGESSSDEDEF